jgi:guanyl-specific ribonuclease Sa
LKKSFYALLFSIVLALVTLVGCGGSSSTAAGSSGKVTLESAPDQSDTQSGTSQESSGADVQSSNLQSAPEQVAEDTKDEAVSGANGTATESKTSSKDEPEAAINEPEATIDENGTYSSKDDVALYLHIYGRLPKNFMTKKEAKKLGWEGGSLEKYAKGMCIGGDHFGNYEGILPQGNYHECDIDTLGRKSRGAKRIIYSDDGRIYYTEDHYETFELLYGEE